MLWKQGKEDRKPGELVPIIGKKELEPQIISPSVEEDESPLPLWQNWRVILLRGYKLMLLEAVER